MSENEKTAPDTLVGASEGQPSNTTNIITQPPQKIKWLSDEKKINEPLFCESFCQNRELRCIDGIFCSVDGEESQDEITAQNSEMYFQNGISTRLFMFLWVS